LLAGSNLDRSRGGLTARSDRKIGIYNLSGGLVSSPGAAGNILSYFPDLDRRRRKRN
jgi:hypothetical protein